MNVRLLAAAALAIVVSALPLRAQTPYLVADLNTTSADGQRSSNPGAFQAFGDTLFFSAQDAQGNELWKYSGGVASRVADIRPGPAGSFPFSLMDIGGGVYLFRASDGPHGYELWRTDGTAAGTSLVKDIHPSTNGLAAWRREVLNGRLFFMANEGVNGAEPWVSDGTAAGTQLLLNLDNASTSSNPTMFVPLGGKMLIFGANGLWSSDGTTLGTTLLASVGGAWGQGRIGNTLYFTATGMNGATGRELWKTDGTTAGTQPVADVIPGPTGGLLTNSLLVPIGSTLYFTAYHPGGGGVDLWKSDGTAAGTQFIKAMTTPNPNPEAWSMFAIGSLLLIEVGDEIWRSDGTAAGTYALDSGNEARNLVPAFGRGYYFRNGTSTDELWSTDGATTQFVAIADSGLQLTSTGGKLYFSAAENLYGQEPWVSESGTTATTHRLANINPDGAPSSSPNTLTAVNDLVFFRAYDGFTRDEIWRSNGTPSGTFRVTSLLGAGGYLALLTGWNGGLYFYKDTQLWRSDGTVAGTAVMKDMTENPVSSMFPGSRYLFLGLSRYAQPTLGRTDGTAAGTITLGGLLPNNQAPGLPSGYAELAGRAFVTGSEYSSREGAWVSDGTPETTKRVVGDEPRVVNVKPAAAAGAFFFTAATAATGTELWRSDGIGGSEMLVKDIAPGEAESYPMDLMAAGRYLYFVANDTVHGVELWRTDGTAAGTILLGDLAAGGPSSQPTNLTAAGELLYFTANDGSHGVELWRTDGTAAGTVMVSDLFPGTSSADPGQLRFAEGTLWFSADNGVAGRELWRVTGAGVPSMVADLAPGADSSYPAGMVQAGQLLYFAATTSTAGTELWAVPLTTSSLRIDDARITEGTGGTRTLRFMVTRTGSASGAASAAFTTVNGSATSGADYAAQSGTVAFTAGQTSRFIDVVVQSDAVVEENEGFFVTLTSPTGATLARGIATGVIDDDDHRAELSIVPLPNIGSSSERWFRIANAGPSAANDVRVRFSESPGQLNLTMYDRCSSKDNPMTCSFDTLAAGASVDFRVEHYSDGHQYIEQEPRPGLTVTASVSATEPDTNPADNITSHITSMEGRIIAPPYLTSGYTTTALVALSFDYPFPVTVSLMSSVSNVAVTPPTVVIPAGQRTAEFMLTIVNYTGPVKLTAPAVQNVYPESSMTLYVVPPGQLPKMASAIAAEHQGGIFGETIVMPVTVAARRHDGTRPTGLVSLLNDAGDVVVAQHPLDAAGKTVFEIEGLQPGGRFYRLRYHGDANFLPYQDARIAVTVQGWPTTLSMEAPPLICSGMASEIYMDVETTATTTPPTGSVEVTIGGTVEMLPLSPTGTPGLSRAILRRPFPAGTTYVSIRYVPTGTFHYSYDGAHIYAQPCVAMNIRATGITSNSVEVNWTPVAGATTYEVLRTVNTSNWESTGTTSSTSKMDGDHPWPRSRLYTVRALNASGQTIGWGAPDIALPMLFANDPLIPNVNTVRGVHHQQVRAGINGMRYLGVNIGDVTDVPVTPPGTSITAAGIMALRAEIATLRHGLGLPQFVFTDPVLTAGSPIKAIHMQELRDAVK